MPLNNLGLGKTLVLMFCICIKIGHCLPLSGVIMQVLYVCAEVLNALLLSKVYNVENIYISFYGYCVSKSYFYGYCVFKSYRTSTLRQQWSKESQTGQCDRFPYISVWKLFWCYGNSFCFSFPTETGQYVTIVNPRKVTSDAQQLGAMDNGGHSG